MTVKLPTSADVKAYRAANIVGIHDAKKALLKKALFDAVDDAKSILDLKEIIRLMIERMS